MEGPPPGPLVWEIQRINVSIFDVGLIRFPFFHTNNRPSSFRARMVFVFVCAFAFTISPAFRNNNY